MSPSTPNRLFSNEDSGLEVDHGHLDRTVEVRHVCRIRPGAAACSLRSSRPRKGVVGVDREARLAFVPRLTMREQIIIRISLRDDMCLHAGLPARTTALPLRCLLSSGSRVRILPGALNCGFTCGNAADCGPGWRTGKWRRPARSSACRRCGRTCPARTAAGPS